MEHSIVCEQQAGLAAAYLLGGFSAVIRVRQCGHISASVFVDVHESSNTAIL